MNALLDHPFLGRGFRPFFLLGALYSILNLLIWSGFYAGYVTHPSDVLDPMSWHAHEMIYGFTMTIVAGFLLTAVANWTGTPPLRGVHLLGLCLLWVVGRVVMSVDLALPPAAIMVLECVFIPALAISLSVPLLKRKNKQNFIFLILLAALFACNVAFHLMAGHVALYVAVMIIVTMISVIGGRIIPSFTAYSLKVHGKLVQVKEQKSLDRLALLSLVLVMLCVVLSRGGGTVMSVLCFTSALIHALRLRYYHTRHVLRDPMLWILHVGYCWVILGLFFMGLSGIGIVPVSIAIHALTTGAIGSMTLGMMCRVSLGHTGRQIIANRLTSGTFILIQICAFIRVFGPLVSAEQSSLWIIASAGVWSLCFALYVVAYALILWQARPDGQPA